MRLPGIIIGAFGLILILAGAAILAVFGADGTLSTDRHRITSTTPALVSGPAAVRGLPHRLGPLGHPSVRIDLGDEQFVGVGRAGDVERYLRGVAYDEVTDIRDDPFELERHSVRGDRVAAAPAAQPIWLAQGTDALRWKLTDGDYRVVVMSADGRSPLNTEAHFGIRIPGLPKLGVILALVGAALALTGLAVVVKGGRRAAENPRSRTEVDHVAIP